MSSAIKFQLHFYKNDTVMHFLLHYVRITSNHNSKMLFSSSSRRSLAKLMTPSDSRAQTVSDRHRFGCIYEIKNLIFL